VHWNLNIPCSTTIRRCLDFTLTWSKLPIDILSFN